MSIRLRTRVSSIVQVLVFDNAGSLKEGWVADILAALLYYQKHKGELTGGESGRCECAKNRISSDNVQAINRDMAACFGQPNFSQLNVSVPQSPFASKSQGVLK